MASSSCVIFVLCSAANKEFGKDNEGDWHIPQRDFLGIRVYFSATELITPLQKRYCLKIETQTNIAEAPDKAGAHLLCMTQLETSQISIFTFEVFAGCAREKLC